MTASIGDLMPQCFVSVFIFSCIDFCNTALYDLLVNTLAPLWRILNAAALFISNLWARAQVTVTPAPCGHYTGCQSPI